jgi:hypothetical protein
MPRPGRSGDRPSETNVALDFDENGDDVGRDELFLLQRLVVVVVPVLVLVVRGVLEGEVRGHERARPAGARARGEHAQ